MAQIEPHLLEGRLADLSAGSRHMIIGRVLAWQLGAEVGDELTVMVPGRSLLSAGGRPVLQTFTVTGVFEVGLQDHDGSLALVALADAAELAGGVGPAGLRLRFDDVMQAPAARPKTVRVALGDAVEVADWTQEHAAYFRAIRIEKTMMSLILLLVVAVAAFNIVAALVMVVNEKRSDIAILRTLGLEPGGVVGAFFTQGLVIGATGTVLGVVLGLAIAFNVGTHRAVCSSVCSASMSWTRASTTSPRFLPTRSLPQVALIATIAFLLTVLATIYPALRGAATHPAEALRYE